MRDLAWLTPEVERAWARHRARFAALYAGCATDGPVAVEGLMAGRSHGLWGTNDPDMLAEPEAWLDDVLADMAAHAGEAADPVTFRPFVVELDAFGTHYIDALFGAHVRYHEGQAWSVPLAIDPAELAPPDLARCEVFRRSIDLARLAVAATRGRLFVVNPVLSCPLNIGINLFGERLLEAMVERPQAADHALRVIADVIGACMRAFAEVIPAGIRLNSVGASRYAPPGRGFIDGCATQLISARHYARYCAPLDAELLRVYPRPGMIHLCGAHLQHIPGWRDMAELKSVQVNDRAAEDFESYWRGLREDQIVSVVPTPGMAVERILALTGGRRVVLECGLPPP